MSDKITKSPKIRFKGFTDAWEQRKLGEMLEERNEQMPENNEYPLMSFVQGAGVSPKGVRYDRSFLVKEDNKKYKKTELGDFIYSSNNLETGSIGFNRAGNAVISPVYSIFSSKNELESRFIGILSTRKDFIAKMVRFRQGVVYGQWRIHERDFLNIEIIVPRHKEQKEIIDSFVNLDNLISLHQRKLELLKETKKSLIQKMFPKDENNIPEIRFEGFTDTWEQRKVGEFLTESKIKGSDGSIAKKLTVKLWRKGIVPKEEIYQGSSATQYYVRKSGQFMYGKLDFLNQAFGIVPPELDGYESTLDSPAFDFRGEINSRFFLEYISLKRFYKYQGNIANGSRKAKRIHAETFFEMPIPVPSYAEQKKIGLFFEQLDTTITLLQREFNLLKNLKKSLLQQMFV